MYITTRSNKVDPFPKENYKIVNLQVVSSHSGKHNNTTGMSMTRYQLLTMG